MVEPDGAHSRVAIARNGARGTKPSGEIRQAQSKDQQSSVEADAPARARQ